MAGAVLVRAIDLRIVGDDQVTAALQRVQQAGTRSMEALAEGARSSSRELARIADIADNSFARLRGPLQNVAFQLQDIVTQLSLGAPAIQVFAVQGAQIMQAFGPLGTILGTVAAAVAALAGAWLGARNHADALEQSTSRLSDAFDRQVERMLDAATTTEDLRARYQALGATQRNLIELTLRGSEVELAQQLDQIISEMQSRFEETAGAIDREIARLRAQIVTLKAPLIRSPETLPRREAERARAEAELRAREIERTRLLEPLERAIETRNLEALAEALALIAREAPREEIRSLADDLLVKAKAAAQATAQLERLREALRAIRGEATGQLPTGEIIPRPQRREVTQEQQLTRIAPLPVPRPIQLQREPAELETLRSEIARRQRELSRLEMLAQGLSEPEVSTRLERQRLEELAVRGGEPAQELMKQLDALDQQIEASRSRWEQYQRTLTSIAETGRRVGDAVSTALARIVSGAESATQAARELLATLAQMIFERTIGAAISSVIGDIVGRVTGSLTANQPAAVPTAHGNVFSPSANLVPFAQGGVIAAPVLFPMSAGRLGLAGEAGPEAILPLRRLPSGDLGVGATPQRLLIEVRSENEGVRVEAPREVTSSEAIVRLWLRRALDLELPAALRRLGAPR